MNIVRSAGLALIGLLVITACGNEPAESTGKQAAAPPSQPAVTSPTPVPPATDSLAAPESAAPATSSPADVEAIRAAGAARDDAYRTGNANAVVAVFENNAVLMPASAPVASGRLAIRKYLANEMTQMSAAGYSTFIPADAVEISVSGDLGYRSGTFSVTDKSGASADSGKWLEIWHRSNGQWLIKKSISNSDSLPLLLNPPEEE